MFRLEIAPIFLEASEFSGMCDAIFFRVWPPRLFTSFSFLFQIKYLLSEFENLWPIGMMWWRAVGSVSFDVHSWIGSRRHSSWVGVFSRTSESFRTLAQRRNTHVFYRRIWLVPFLNSEKLAWLLVRTLHFLQNKFQWFIFFYYM